MWTAENIDEAYDLLLKINMDRPVVEQPIYNMLDRDQVEGALEDAVARRGMGLVVFSPLAEGVLTGKYNDGIPEAQPRHRPETSGSEDQLTDERIEQDARHLTALAQEMGTTTRRAGACLDAQTPARQQRHYRGDQAVAGRRKSEGARREDHRRDRPENRGILQNKPVVSATGSRREPMGTAVNS